MGGPKPPSTPQYIAPPPYTSPTTVLPDVQEAVPQVMTPSQILGQANASLGIEGDQVPSYLASAFSENPLSPENLSQYEQNYNAQNVAPQIASLESQLQQGGQGGSLFAGGELGAAQSEGALSSYNAGLNFAQNQYQDQLAGLASYFSGPVGLQQEQNNTAVQTGLNEYGLAQGTAGMQNTYGLDTTGMQNQFNQTNYQDQIQQYQAQLQAQSQRLGSIFGGIGSLVGAATGLAGLGGGGGSGGGISGGGSAPYPSFSDFSSFEPSNISGGIQ